MSTKDRPAAVSGKFYPADPIELHYNVKSYLEANPAIADDKVAALIVPHAGFIFSGEVAAFAYNQIPSDKKYHNVFVIGPSHRSRFEGASVYNLGDYETPLGKVKVNINLANELISSSSLFTYKPEADLYEHNLEVQLPFLQEKLGENLQIIPILIGSENKIVLNEIAQRLSKWFNQDNLFIISTDFSHYPAYNDAKKADSVTAEAIVQNDPEKLYSALRQNTELNIKGLSTSLCGANAISVLLNLTHKSTNYSYIPLHYKNSGDSPLGEKERVVGYYSMKVVRDIPESSSNLSEVEKKQLLHIARKTLEFYLKNNEMPGRSEIFEDFRLSDKFGVFVTLYKESELRGCIGRFNPEIPLPDLVMEMAISSALYDRRFKPLTLNELRNIRIEISVLTPLKKISSIDEIVLGKHGIYISKGHNNGTFLPKVAQQTGWSITSLLGHCSRDKAGLGWEGWKEADIYTYESIDFGE